MTDFFVTHVGDVVCTYTELPWYQVVLQITNSAAGFYAAVVWGYFFCVRKRKNSASMNALTFILAVSSLGIGLSYLLSVFGRAPDWVLGSVGVRSLITPIVLLPAIIHMSHWKRATSGLQDVANEIRGVATEIREHGDSHGPNREGGA